MGQTFAVIGRNDDRNLARAGLWRREGPHLPWGRRGALLQLHSAVGAAAAHASRASAAAERARGVGRGRTPLAPGTGG